jgi:hypothetical protein
MDLNTLMGAMLSSDSIKSISKASGASQKDVKAVLSSALPGLLNGAAQQANNSQTAAGFAGALAQHAKSDTRDLGSFLSGVDLADGGKIIAHLLGANTTAATQQTASASGVDAAKVAKILAVAAPLLMSLLGKQAGQTGGGNLGALMNSLLGGGNAGSLIGSLLGVSTPQTTTTTTVKKKKTAAGSTAKKTGTTAKKTGTTTARKTGTAAKKTSTARKPSTAAKKKPAPKSDEAALLDALVGLLK